MPKTVLIIGASKGIGKELIREFSFNDYEIYSFARSFENHSDENIHYINIDLEDPNFIESFKKTIDSIPKIDYLINNAGAIVVKPFTELTHKDILMCYQVNVIAVMQCIQVCLPKLHSKSHVVSISSMGGFQGSMKFAGLSAYSTSKAAVASLTELLAEEYKETGIAFNCLCLGAVQTEMLEKAFPGYQAPLNPSEMAKYIADFTQNAHNYLKGKIIPVSLTNP